MAKKKSGITSGMKAAMEQNQLNYVLNNPYHKMDTPQLKAMWNNTHRSGESGYKPQKDGRFVI